MPDVRNWGLLVLVATLGLLVVWAVCATVILHFLRHLLDDSALVLRPRNGTRM